MRAAFEAVPHIEDPLPAWMVEKYRLCSKEQAVRSIHFPRSMADVHAARRRLIFEELLVLQLGLLLLRGREAARTGAPMRPADLSPFLGLTALCAHRRTAARSTGDCPPIWRPKTPMNRLLQGDVGSGKTLVAAAAVLWRRAERLPERAHGPHRNFSGTARGHAGPPAGAAGHPVALLTGSVKGAREKGRAAGHCRGGSGTLVVGTHAVLSAGVEFARLGFAVTDEQHRFGVRQRSRWPPRPTIPTCW